LPFGPTYSASQLGGPLRQCEIVANVAEHIASLSGEDPSNVVGLAVKLHPLVIVLTQDCDLNQDFVARGSADSKAAHLLHNILLCDLYYADDVKADRGVIAGSDIWKRVFQNKDERFQYLREILPRDDFIATGLSPLVADFKRIFTLPTESLYVQLNGQAKRRACINSPYLEHVSARHSHFLSRIALPLDHHDPVAE
jgi:hypothetical protein